MKKIFYGTVKRGKVYLDDQDLFDSLALSMEGQEVEVTLSKKYKHRSLRQSKYYFGVVLPMLEEATGYSEQEIHDALRLKFLSVDKDIPTIRSTSDLSTVSFEKYMSQIRQWASEFLNVQIPEPNEGGYLI